MVVAVEVTSEDPLPPELVDGRRGDAKLASDLLAAEHAAGTQPFIAALEPIGLANDFNLLNRERLATPVAVSELVESTGDFLIGAGLQQFVDQGHD